MSVTVIDSGILKMPSVRTYKFSIQPKQVWQTGVTLPTTKPIPGQFSFNVDNTTIPIASSPVLSMRYVPIMMVCGQNSSGSSATISYEVLRNGSTIASGTSSSIANGSYWLFEHMKETYSWQTGLGDSFEIRLYSSVSGVTLDGTVGAIVPARVDIGLGSNVILKDCTLTTTTIFDSKFGIVTTNPNNGKSITSSWAGAVYIYPTTSTSTTNNGVVIPSSGFFPVIYPHPIFKIGDTQGGFGLTSVGFSTSTTAYSVQHPQFLYSISGKVVNAT